MLCLALAAAGRVSAQESVEYDGTDALGSIRVVFDQSGGVRCAGRLPAVRR